jgi:multiple sugar transport system ATP-binding protein
VALARAIVREPNVFLMDEPLSNLDAKLRVSTRAQIKNLSHELKVTTVYVTHDQIEAMTLADRVVVMKQGKVQQVGTPTDIYDNPANTFVASFIGSPAMNLMDGEISGGTFHGTNVTIPGIGGPDGSVTLGFRAEDAALADTGAGEITAPIYTIELLGDATMLTVRAGGQLVSVKAHKEFRAEIGDIVSFSVPAWICHLFDTESGMRIERA